VSWEKLGVATFNIHYFDVKRFPKCAPLKLLEVSDECAFDEHQFCFVSTFESQDEGY